MELELVEVYKRLGKKKIMIDKNEIIKYLNDVKKITLNLIENLLHDNDGFQRDKKIGIGSEHDNINGGQGTNPALWELGHIAMFYDYHLLRYLEMRKYPIIDNWEIYDSFITNRKSRFEFKEHSKEKLIDYYLNVIQKSIKKLQMRKKKEELL